MKSLRANAPAKINLTLEILGKRDDGFHEIATLMHTLTLSDELTFRARADEKIILTCDDPSLSLDDSNLVVKAALALRAASDTKLGAEIQLIKRIPHGAGLGGGSSDAATTLVMLNQLWELGFTHPQLSEVAATLGSDVAFFLSPPVAICRGRGELVTPLADFEAPEAFGAAMTLVFPALTVSTPKVYQSGAIDLTSPRVPIDSNPCLPFNRLQGACCAVFPEVAAALTRATAALAGADFAPIGEALLNGSGSSFMFFWANAGHAHSAATRLRSALPADYQVFVTHLG